MEQPIDTLSQFKQCMLDKMIVLEEEGKSFKEIATILNLTPSLLLRIRLVRVEIAKKQEEDRIKVIETDLELDEELE